MQRRGLVPPNYYDTSGAGGGVSGAYGKPGAIKAAAAAKRQQPLAAAAKYGPGGGSNMGPSNNSARVGGGMVVGQTPTLATLKLGGGGGGSQDGTGPLGSGTFKFKANNPTKASSKYVSPYSLRHLAGGGTAGMGASGS